MQLYILINRILIQKDKQFLLRSQKEEHAVDQDK